MARKSPSRLELRKQAEAVESKKAASGEETVDKKAAKKKKKKKTTRVSKRAKAKTPQRRRLMWGIFSGSMKEEARFAYDQREAAEEKMEQLRGKSKKLYFIQPIKEPIADAPAEESVPDKEAKEKADKTEEA